MNLAEFATRIWPQLAVTAKTLDNYQGAFRRNVPAIIANKSLSEISKGDLVEFLAFLPPQTRYQTLMMLRTLFREAIARELMGESPAAGIRTPVVSVQPSDFLTMEQVLSTDFGRHTDAIRFIALHGLRWGEAKALTADDIRDGRVHITKSIHGRTKSQSGNRTVPYMGYWPGEFPSRSSLIRALAKHGVNLHSLRKTYAYGLKSSGVHVTTAAKLMGHSNPTITMKIYTYVLDVEVDDAGDALRARYGSAA